MEVLVANVEHIKFDVEIALEEQFGALPLPFPGMDSKTQLFCFIYVNGTKVTVNYNAFRIHSCRLRIL